MGSVKDLSETDCEFNPLEESEDDGDHQINKTPVEKERPLRSVIWKYFDKDPSQDSQAICRFCQKDLSFKTTISNLKKHLKNQHAAQLDTPLDTTTQNNEDENFVSVVDKPDDSAGKQKKSAAWKYFTLQGRKRARCRLCAASLSYAASVSNLAKHLARRHDSIHLKNRTTAVAPVWAYFKCLDAGSHLASCLLCRKRVLYSETLEELRRHLQKKHPQVDLDDSTPGKTFMVTDSGELYEIDTEQSDPAAVASDEDTKEYSEEHYLDDAFEEIEENINKSPKRKFAKIHVVNKKPLKMEKDSFTTTDPVEDTIDIFGKYIVSLLKKMPNNISDKLQYEIVKQIFEAQSPSVKDDIISSNSDKIPVTDT